MLFVCHWLADYTPLSTMWMLKAKQYGKPIFPILCHALVHGLLMGIVLSVFVGLNTLTLSLIIFQVLTHWIIDIGKGKVTYYLPVFRDNMKPPYWVLMGFDQLLHTIVIITMVNYTI